MRKRIARYNDAFGPDLAPGMMVLSIFLMAAVLLAVFFALNAETDRPLSGEGTYRDWSVTEPPVTDPPVIPPELTETFTVPDTDMTRGYLVLVNAEHEYKFGSEDIVTLYHNPDKSGSYGLLTSSLGVERSILPYLNALMDAYVADTADDHALLSSAYRSYEEQEKELNDRIEKDGEEEAYRYVAVPGHSEHHTGLGVDLGANADRDWMPNNSWRYGFIQRYRTDKIAITGIAYEYWHYRYVGAPFAELMHHENLCLEEFVELVHTHPYEAPFEYTTEDGKSYYIYYTPCSGEGQTEIKVPRGAAYTVSGDNAGGFIVAAEKTPA